MADPLGRMSITASGYHELTLRMRNLAESVCQGRLIGFQEGGYSADYVPYCTVAIIEGLSGQSAGVADRWSGTAEHARALASFDPREEEAIEAVRAMQRAHWDLE
jgi:acetoin utilization deacetylase AcuC-like enzyme